jgi:transcriptional regulator with XRE-family HTH domain
MIGEILRDARMRHGVTQKQLSSRAQTSQAAISRIERGVVSPTLDTATRLLDLLGEELHLSAEPIVYGHDRTLLRENLELTPEERIRKQAAWSNRVRTLPRVG